MHGKCALYNTLYFDLNYQCNYRKINYFNNFANVGWYLKTCICYTVIIFKVIIY